MFGSSVRLRDGVAGGSRNREFETPEEAGASSGAIERGLDALGLGVWCLDHTGGGCHALALHFDNGSGDYVYVTDSEGPLSGWADADDFGSGAVMVGFYAGEQWEELTNCEGVYFTEGIAEGVERETAIVDAVRRVFDAVGLTVDVDGLDWERIALAVSAGVCNVCDGVGVQSWGGEDSPCWGCLNIAEASKWERPTV